MRDLLLKIGRNQQRHEAEPILIKITEQHHSSKDGQNRVTTSEEGLLSKERITLTRALPATLMKNLSPKIHPSSPSTCG